MIVSRNMQVSNLLVPMGIIAMDNPKRQPVCETLLARILWCRSLLSRASRVSFAVVLVATLCGCAPFSGYPARATLPADDLEALKGAINAQQILVCLAADPVDALGCRNKLIAARIHAIDVQFTLFEARLFRETREAGFAATIATLGLQAGGAVASGGTSQVLSAIGAAITGSRVAFEKEVLAERTLLVIHTSMRANRAIVLTRIRQGLNRGVAEYPLGIALTDVEDYYFQGTVLGALVGISRAVGVQAEEAERNLAIASGLSQSEAAKALRRFADQPGLTGDELDKRAIAIKDAYIFVGGPDPNKWVLGTFIRDDSKETEVWRAKVYERLKVLKLIP